MEKLKLEFDVTVTNLKERKERLLAQIEAIDAKVKAMEDTIALMETELAK